MTQGPAIRKSLPRPTGTEPISKEWVTQISIVACHLGMVPTPPGYRFVHNLPNKPLTVYQFCRILKTKEIVCKIFKTLELWLLWLSTTVVDSEQIRAAGSNQAGG